MKVIQNKRLFRVDVFYSDCVNVPIPAKIVA